MEYTPPPFDPDGVASGPDQSYFESDGIKDGAIVPANAVEHTQREIVNVIKAAGIDPNKNDLSQLLKSILQLGSYDIPFNAGYGNSGGVNDLAAQSYGLVLLSRDVDILDIEAKIETAPVGSALTFDIQVDGVSIFNDLPSFADGQTILTPGELKSAPYKIPSGSKVEFKVFSVGSTSPGQGLLVSAKGQTSTVEAS